MTYIEGTVDAVEVSMVGVEVSMVGVGGGTVMDSS
jgi:hypothetical protein